MGMVKRDYATTRFKKMILGSHVIIAMGLFFTYADPIDAWMVFGGPLFIAAASLYVVSKYLMNFDRKTKLTFREITKLNYISYVAAILCIFGVIARTNTNSFDFYTKVLINGIIIVLFIPVVSILSYNIFYEYGIHNITPKKPEITTTQGSMGKFIGITFVFPIVILGTIRGVILGDHWEENPLDVLTVIVEISIILLLVGLNVVIYRKHRRFMEEEIEQELELQIEN